MNLEAGNGGDQVCRAMIEGQLFSDSARMGSWNMAFDEAMLIEGENTGTAALRFYSWSRPTLSLGYFQALHEREQHAHSQACDVVRRPSGGGAILHHRELTYALVLPAQHPLTAQTKQLYAAVHSTLIDVLASLGLDGTLCESRQPDSATPPPFLCFLRREAGDVLVDGHKVAGSAQRRRQGAVLQHGSVLFAQSPHAPELLGLQELANTTVTEADLMLPWIDKLADVLQIQWQTSSFSTDVSDRAQRLMAGKYGQPAWLNRRR